MTHMKYAVILYYKFVILPDAQAEMVWQRKLCENLGIKGRILLAAEGINGTLAGTAEAVDAYIDAMNNHELFSGIVYKRDESETIPFPRLRIKVRPEIVTLGIEVDQADTATMITPDEFDEMLKDPNVVVFDTRNNYESAIGKFKRAVTPDIRHFKDLPDLLDGYEDIKDKKVVTYCTGGIRCEKVTALMKRKGFNDLYQLEGGIIKYAQAKPDGAFEGECFVFDERMKVGFGDAPQAIGSCRLCPESTNDYHNCANKACNELILLCPACADFNKVCSNQCAQVMSVEWLLRVA